MLKKPKQACRLFPFFSFLFRAASKLLPLHHNLTFPLPPDFLHIKAAEWLKSRWNIRTGREQFVLVVGRTDEWHFEAETKARKNGV